ncbi:MAG TPA: immunoglobulin domain-containing protein, partial [Verrucomicrobiae bacterium]|nr:immunoglobulin domain-containing protein [Verrucomicrobiae bacterium]
MIKRRIQLLLTLGFLGFLASQARSEQVVISEIMYHPPDLPNGADNSFEEYIMVRNISGAPVPLFDPAFPTNRWKLRDAVEFVFPHNATVPAGASLLVVGFDPSIPGQRAAFDARYPLLATLPHYGPYQGKLDHSSDSVELARPDAPNLTEVPYVLADKVEYEDVPPWPAAADGAGPALQRVSLSDYGNDPAQWVAAAPLTIVNQPPSFTVRPGDQVILNVNAIGTGMLRYQWRRDGLAIDGATNDTLVLPDVQEADQGDYTVLISDATGTIVSEPGFLGVLVSPYIVLPPVSQSVVEGGSVTFSIVTGGHLPMSYRWRKGSATVTNYTLNGHTAFLVLNNVQAADAGNYSVVLTNAPFHQPGLLSPAATLTVLADTDQDGLPDVWESAHGFNPDLAGDDQLDGDLDGMT